MNLARPSCSTTQRVKVRNMASIASELSWFKICLTVTLIGRYTDHEVVAKLAELDMMVADLERANSRVVTVERRNVSEGNFLSAHSSHVSIFLGAPSCRD